MCGISVVVKYDNVCLFCKIIANFLSSVLHFILLEYLCFYLTEHHNWKKWNDIQVIETKSPLQTKTPKLITIQRSPQGLQHSG